MTLSDVSIERPVLTWMLMIAIAVFGVLGYQRLGVDQYPDIESPTITIDARLEGASPEGIEEDVTDVLEESLATLSGLREIRSTSYQGAARVEVEFELGTDLDVAVQDVRDAVAQAMFRLPDGIETPVVSRRRASGFPVLYAPFYTSGPVTDLSEYVERFVKPRIETIPGVASVIVFGERERTIRIWLDADRMRARGIAANDVMNALRREHVDTPGGFVEGPGIEWAVKTDAEFRSLDAMRRMVVSNRGGVPVHLEDVARVEDGIEDVRELVHFNGQDTVAIGVIKQSDANTVAIANQTFERLEALRPSLPQGMQMAPRPASLDFSKSIIESVAETQFALVFGGLLAILVVFVFLRRSRPTFIIALAIPLSMIGTFGLVWAAGNTLNTMTLLGLTLAIGVVIDDAIIVLENIERHREGGRSAREAARVGTREITFAAAAATFSVAVVFVPVVFAEGIVGAFLGEFGFTVASAVILSLFVALTLTPMLAARMPPPEPRRPGSIYERLESGFRSLEQGYRTALEWSLRHRALTLGLAVLSLLVSVGFGSALGAEFFPPADSGMIFVQFEAPPGSSLEQTAGILARNEETVLAIPEAVGVFSSLGHSSSAGVGRPSAGNMNINVGSRNTRERSSDELIREIRQRLNEVPGQRVQVVDPMSTMNSANAEFEMLIRGALSLQELDSLSQRMLAALGEHPGFVDLDTNLDLGLPELRVVPDREKAAALGVDAATLAQTVQVMIGGLDVGVYKERGGRYDIRMRLEGRDRRSPGDVDDLFVRAADGQLVELRNIVKLVPGAAASEISRTDRQRSVALRANLEGIALGEAVRIAEEAAARILPPDAVLSPSGDVDAMKEGFAQFGLMLALAVLAIYMVLASQFESFLMPLSVMAALPFSMVGALGGLFVAARLGMSGMTFNLFSLIGIVLLTGLVTKNSILLVDYANQLRAEGMDRLEAMRTAAPVRMRPVLMTAFSMIFGVLPAALGIGPGSETRAPMAVATAAGMFSSMLLTLLIVPVFYLVVEDLSEWLRALPRRLRGRAAAAGAAVHERGA